MALLKFINRLVLLFCLTNSKVYSFVEFGNQITNFNGSNTILKLINHIEKTVQNEIVLTGFMDGTALLEYNDLPVNCSQREKLKSQPKKDKNSRLKKCCPIGESLNVFGNDKSQICESNDLNFQPKIINAILYDNCIEDLEAIITLPLEIGNPCNTSIVYNNGEDKFYILQDGSLLIMDEFANDTYTVQQKYCLDMDIISKTMYAFLCITSVEEHLQRGQVVTIAIFTLISIPCLCLVSYLHLTIKELRTLHGISLSLMSLCLMFGYFLHSLVHIFNVESSKIGYFIQFFILSFFFWYFCLCGNVLLNIWLKIPLNKRCTKYCTLGGLIMYIFISFIGPFTLVILTVNKGLPGMPSYFLQGITESIRGSQRYFIPPISTILFTSFIFMIISFFGFQRIKKHKQNKGIQQKISKYYFFINTEIDEGKHEEIKKDAKCISLLGIILIVTWLLEIITFYSPGPQNYLILMEIINGLQGVFIMLIFLVVRRRRTIILRWWFDRGSHDLETVELKTIE